jgi:hypothetical protein
VNYRDVAAHAYAAGFRGDALVMAVAIAKRESAGPGPVESADFDAGAIGDKNNPRQGCNSWGLMQINVCPDGNNRGIAWRENPRLLLDPATNMRAAFEMSRGGTDWYPWMGYRSGIVSPDIAGVRKALAGLDVAQLQPGSSTSSAQLAGISVPNPLGGLEALGTVANFFAMLAKPETWRRVLLFGAGIVLTWGGAMIVLTDSAAGAALGSRARRLARATAPTAKRSTSSTSSTSSGGIVAAERARAQLTNIGPDDPGDAAP